MSAHEYPEGTHYRLPDWLTWERVAQLRKSWGIDPSEAPLVNFRLTGGPSVIAWGRLLPNDYRILRKAAGAIGAAPAMPSGFEPGPRGRRVSSGQHWED